MNNIVELRQYTLHPGQRETLITLFDREFVETQEQCGVQVIGQFRDLDRPDMFVWIRGFESMNSRKAALSAFYGGSVWKIHKQAANATMIDSDNVLLLHPARSNSGFHLESPDRAELSNKKTEHSLLIVGVGIVNGHVQHAMSAFENALMPALLKIGARHIAYFISESSENTFPTLPVRPDQVFVWSAAFPSMQSFQDNQAALSESLALLALQCSQPLELLRLSPTSRSLLHG